MEFENKITSALENFIISELFKDSFKMEEIPPIVPKRLITFDRSEKPIYERAIRLYEKHIFYISDVEFTNYCVLWQYGDDDISDFWEIVREIKIF